MTTEERVAVAFIRALNGHIIAPETTDEQLLSAHGHAAMPMATALVAAIREEVDTQVQEKLDDHRQYWHPESS